MKVFCSIFLLGQLNVQIQWNWASRAEGRWHGFSEQARESVRDQEAGLGSRTGCVVYKQDSRVALLALLQLKNKSSHQPSRCNYWAVHSRDCTRQLEKSTHCNEEDRAQPPPMTHTPRQKKNCIFFVVSFKKIIIKKISLITFAFSFF